MVTSMKSRRTASAIGEQLRTWRKLLGLTAEQVAERAGISRGTLRRLEQGETSVGFDIFLEVTRVLGLTEQILKAVDPYETDLGTSSAGPPMSSGSRSIWTFRTGRHTPALSHPAGWHKQRSILL